MWSAQNTTPQIPSSTSDSYSQMVRRSTSLLHTEDATLENVPAVGGPATNYLRGDSKPQPTLPSSLPQKLPTGWGGEIVTPPASANMRPFKTAVSPADMNLSSGWNQHKKAPALHFDDQGRQPNYVRFEEVSFEFYLFKILKMMMVMMTLMRTPPY